MKFSLLVGFLLAGVIPGKHQKPKNEFTIKTFTAVPKDMEGCGENLFLNKQDEKAERFIFYTDYPRGLICVNGHMILLTHKNKSVENSSNVYADKDYNLLIIYVHKKIKNNV